MILIAGANGSGKSTFSTLSRREQILVVDPDAIAREHKLSRIGAGRKALVMMRNYFDATTSFSVETTLSGRLHFGMIENARTRGYAIELVYVGTADVAINLERIRQRVAAGGHDVPEADVVRRAKRSFEHAPEIVPLADNIAVFDNSGDEMLPLITFEDGVVSEYHTPPAWAEAIVTAVRARANPRN